MKAFLISVIIPIYNAESYLDRCISSICEQTYRDLEIILVNDGSTDASLDICLKYQQKDNRIRVLSQKNKGIIEARKLGVQSAQGNIIGFVDSDDWIDIDYFGYLLEKIKNNKADIVVGKYVSEYETKTTELYRSAEKMYEGRTEIYALLDFYFRGISLKDNLITYCRWDKVYKRSILLSNFKYLDTKISLGEDINTNCAVIPDCERILVLNQSPYYHYRQNAVSIANTFDPKQIDNIEYLYCALSNIANEKDLNTREINIFIGDMIYTQIRQIYDSEMEPKKRLEYLNYIVEKTFMVAPMKSYAEVHGRLKKVFISLFVRKKFGMCGVINNTYNQIKK